MLLPSIKSSPSCSLRFASAAPPRTASVMTADYDIEAWGALIAALEDECDDEGDEKEHESVAFDGGGRVRNRRGRTSAWAHSGDAARTSPRLTEIRQPSPSPRWLKGGGLDEDEGGRHPSLNDWILSHGNKGGESIKPIDVAGRRKYIEKSVRILHSLACNLVGGPADTGNCDEQVAVHPNFITVSNVTVSETTTMFTHDDDKTISADFVQFGDSIYFDESGEDETRKKYLAMDALGRLAYEMIMLGERPSVDNFCSQESSATEASISNSLSIHDQTQRGGTETADADNKIIDMLRKNPCMTTSEGTDGRGLISIMLDANLPFPLCRFISDLLDDGSMFRSDHAFSSFEDVVSDLKQMMDNPDRFLHASSPDRWKLVFGEKLYSRDDDMKAFMDAAERVGSIWDDPIFEGLACLKGRKREVVMVSGHSGAGKSQLVRSCGSFLEKRRWRFLRCKFDRVGEPLSSVFSERFWSALDLTSNHYKRNFICLRMFYSQT